MTSRIAAGLLALVLGGCASEPLTPWQQPMSQLGAINVMPPDVRGDVTAVPVKKTVASKVLSAMAFEKVTGLKADPARLLETE